MDSVLFAVSNDKMITERGEMEKSNCSKTVEYVFFVRFYTISPLAYDLICLTVHSE